jgi:hypothetical protein
MKCFWILGEGPICWLPCERTDYNFECGILCTANDEQCGLVTTNSVAAGLSMFAGILFSPLIITNSVYSSAVSASVATGSGAAWLTSSFLYESCNIRHWSRPNLLIQCWLILMITKYWMNLSLLFRGLYR